MTSQYALVAYVHNSVGAFVADLRRDLYPGHGHSHAHISVLPPRCLQGSEEDAMSMLAEACREIEPFEVLMGEVQTFLPVTPTVFIRVARAAYRVRELHDRLNADGLTSVEPWPFMPHLTLFKMDTNEQAQAAIPAATERWAAYSGTRRITIDELTFVKSLADGWVDIAPIRLGRTMATAR